MRRELGLPGETGLRTKRFHCRRHGFCPWSGKLRSCKPHLMVKKKFKRRVKIVSTLEGKRFCLREGRRWGAGKGDCSFSVLTSPGSHTVFPQRCPCCRKPLVLFALLAQPFRPHCLSCPCFVREQRASRTSGGKGLISRQQMPEPLSTQEGTAEKRSVCVVRLSEGLMESTLVGCLPM